MCCRLHRNQICITPHVIPFKKMPLQMSSTGFRLCCPDANLPIAIRTLQQHTRLNPGRNCFVYSSVADILTALANFRQTQHTTDTSKHPHRTSQMCFIENSYQIFHEIYIDLSEWNKWCLCVNHQLYVSLVLSCSSMFCDQSFHNKRSKIKKGVS